VRGPYGEGMKAPLLELTLARGKGSRE